MKPSPKEPTAGHTKTNDVKNLRLQLSECGKSLETCGLVSVTIARLNPCGSLTPQEQREVAGFIVTACNHHAELKNALDGLLNQFVTAEAYPEYKKGELNDRFIDMASAETVARTLLSRLNAK